MSAPIKTQEARYWIKLSEGDLRDALLSLSQQTGVSILYPYHLIQARDVRPVVGNYTISEALELLLKGTGFSGGLSRQGVITISLRKQGCDKKRETMLRQSKSTVSLIALFMGAFSASVCQAQAQERAAAATPNPSEVESVTVTGTLIRGEVAPVGTNLVTVDAKDIAASGAMTTNQVLQNIPQLANQFNTVTQSGTGLGNATQLRPSIRNFGGSGGATTLLLINGQHAVGTGVLATEPDGSSVPAMVLERVDVVPDGASAIYGSNAVAGIINFITRTRFDGVQAQASYGTTGDFNTFQGGVMGGHSWSDGSALLAYEFRSNSNQLMADRPYIRNYLVPLGGTADGRITNCALPNVTAGGVAYALRSNAVPNAPGALAANAAPGTNRCDTTLLRTTMPSETNHTVFGSISQELADGVDFSMTANWSRRMTTALIAPPTSANLTINSNNPYFQSIAGETTQAVSFDYSPIVGSSLPASTNLEQYGLVPKLSFELGDDWNLTVVGNYGRSETRLQTRSANAVAATNALVANSTSFALNPYNLALSNPSVLSQITLFGNYARSTQQLAEARADLTGTLFSLPGGDVKAAVGTMFNYTDIVAKNVVGPLGQFSGPPVAGGLIVGSNAQRSIHSVFGEVLIPVVGPENAMPLMHSLNIDISGRWDHYSDVGGTTNPKIGVTYEPIPSLQFRGNIGTSFNAPSLADTAGAADTRVVFSGNSNTRLVPGTPTSQGARPSFVIAGGNPLLRPQTANTHSFGFEYRPDFIEGLEISLTKWHVGLHRVISVPPFNNPAVLYTTPSYTPYFTLNPSQAFLESATAGIARQGFGDYSPYYQPGALTPYVILDARRQNLGNQFIDGLDFHVNYTMSTDFGSAEFGLDGTALTEETVQAFPGAPMTNFLAANVSPMQISGFVGATAGPLNGRLRINHNEGFAVTGVAPQTSVESFTTVNLFVGYDLSDFGSVFENATFNVNIDNLFDETPPFYNASGGLPVQAGYDGVPGTANGSTLGRLVQFSLQKRF